MASPVAGANVPSRWYLFYLFPLGLSVLNLGLVVVAFRDGLGMVRGRAGGAEERAEGNMGNSGAMVEVKRMLKLRNLWLLSLFFFFHLGAATTTGGMSYSISISFQFPLSKVHPFYTFPRTHNHHRLGSVLPRPSPPRPPLHRRLPPHRLLRRALPRPPPAARADAPLRRAADAGPVRSVLLGVAARLLARAKSGG